LGLWGARVGEGAGGFGNFSWPAEALLEWGNLGWREWQTGEERFADRIDSNIENFN